MGWNPGISSTKRPRTCCTMASFASTSASFVCPMTLRSPMIKFLPEQNCPLLQSCFAELVFAIWEPCINVERPQSEGYYDDQPWRNLIRDDLHWLWRQLHHCSTLQDPQQHFPAWEYLLRYHHGYWKRLVARGITHAIRQRKNATWLADSHRRVFHLLGQHGTLVPGDYQWYLERMMQGAPDGLTLYVVSLDIVIDKKYGDLADLDARNFWLSHIMQGHVHGFLGGSPCCTFSKPRSVALHQEHRCRAPRPARMLRNCGALRLWLCVSLMLCWKGTFCSAFALKPFLRWRSWADKVYLNTQLSRKPMMRLRFGNFRSFACCSTCRMYRRLSFAQGFAWGVQS